MKTVFVVVKSYYIGDGDFNTEVDSVYANRADADAYVKQFPEYQPGKINDVYSVKELAVQ